MTIKILVCAPVAPPLGGIATWSEELKSLNFYDKGFGVNIFPTNIPGRKSRMYGYFYRLINGLFYGIPFVLRYFVELVVGRYSVVHVCTSGGFAHFRDIFLLSVANLFGIKTIIHLHFGCVDQGYKWVPGGRLFLQLAAKLADNILVLDERMINLFPCGKAKLIGNYISPRSDRINFEDKLSKFLYIGWIVPDKGIYDLLNAWSEIGDANGWTLEVVGPADDENLKKIQQYTLKFKNIKYYGSVDRETVFELIKSSKVLVLPSKTEGFPFVLIEAMRYACAVLVSNVGGISQIFSKVPMSPPGVMLNGKSFLADEIKFFIRNPDVVNCYCTNAKNIFDNFYTHDVFINDLVGVWGKLVPLDKRK